MNIIIIRTIPLVIMETTATTIMIGGSITMKVEEINTMIIAVLTIMIALMALLVVTIKDGVVPVVVTIKVGMVPVLKKTLHLNGVLSILKRNHLHGENLPRLLNNYLHLKVV